MTFIHNRKRAAYSKTVQLTLNEILNDSDVMPNADCPDLFVSVNRVAFGPTVRDIYIDVWGLNRKARVEGEEPSHKRYQREANEHGGGGYCDLTDMFCLPHLTEIIAKELQHRLQLRYTPTIRRFCDLVKAKSNGKRGRQ